MKSNVKVAILVFIAFAFSLFSATGATMEATVVSAKGKTEIQKGDKWIPLQVGSTISKGSVIQTGFKSELILKIKNSTITVAPLSRLTFEQLSSSNSKDTTRVFLDTGSLKSNVKKTSDRRVGFTVRSPVATASVRGTSFDFTNAYNSSVVIGYEGAVSTWKNTTPATAEIAEDEEAPEQQTEMDSRHETSPKGAFTVKRNQEASFAKQGPSRPPMQNAASKASPTGSVNSPVPVVDQTLSTPNKSGIVKVVISIE